MGQQPQTRRAIKEQQRGRRGILPVLIGVLAVVVLGAAVWFGKGLFTSAEPTGSPSAIPGVAAPLTTTPAPSTTPSTTPSETTGATETPEVDPIVKAVASCRAKWALQSAARADAYRSLSQWDRHLKIMNDLQAGKLTLAEAKAAWPATTEKAADNIVAFRAADKALAASKDACAVAAGATGADADAIRRCAASLKAVGGVLARARVAIAPWETHLKDQSHFKAGGMTPAAAEAAWRALWQKGLATLPGYQAVAPQGQAAACTLPS
ncbi:hypothetical protein [Terrabacter sp. Soil810]|uniref:hypothetical protein n=1 Tax=Terrabacter sp. Soil810 TaxID=1736418 RepID=UPI000709FF8F|nr:hypothetical protein [Terrabacter sp. Soil810]KRF38069.1 hypothetical protein ASG96_16420 [Terrabacter sp. Soil810]